MNDDRLQRALDELAARPQVGDMNSTLRKAERRVVVRRRHAMATRVGAAFAVVGLVVGTVAVASDDSDRIDLVPATTADAPAPGGRVLDPGAIVAVRADGVIVELDQHGNELRELYDAVEGEHEIVTVETEHISNPLYTRTGSTISLDLGGGVAPTPDGSTLYVATPGIDCGILHKVDLASGSTSKLGPAAAVAVSGDGRFLAIAAKPDAAGRLTCSGFGAESVVVREIATGKQYEFWRGPEVTDLTARSVALNGDGSRLAISACRRGGECTVFVGDVELGCFARECDYETETWTEMRTIVQSCNPLVDATFNGGELMVSSWDCQTPNTPHIVAHDPDMTTRITTIRDLPLDWIRTVSIEGDSILALVGQAELALLSPTDEVRFRGTYWAGALVPISETPTTPTTAPSPTTVPKISHPTTIAAGAIVVARPDGTIVEVDDDGNEVQVLYRAGERVAQLLVRLDPPTLWVLLDDDAGGPCGVARQIDLVTGAVNELGEAAGIAVSGDGRVIALAAGGDSSDPQGCPGGFPMSVEVRHRTSGLRYALPNWRPEYGWPAGASDLALDHDGSHLVFQACFEGCRSHLAGIPIGCLAGAIECDLTRSPSWDDLPVLAHGGEGFDAGVPDFAFRAGTIVAAECDCAIDAESPAYRLVVFDAETGERLEQLSDLPDDFLGFAMDGTRTFVVVGDRYLAPDEMTLIEISEERRRLPGNVTAVTLVPAVDV